MNDNLITMTRGIIRFLLLAFVLLSFACRGYERIGIISDAILTQINPYNAYFKTPEFFLQDVRADLVKSGISVVSVNTTQRLLSQLGFTQYDIETLSSLQQGYDLDYALLKKVARAIGVKKLVVMTSSVDIQRDFLKNTLWNVANGFSKKYSLECCKRIRFGCSKPDTQSKRVCSLC